jgi:hypothetical protein
MANWQRKRDEDVQALARLRAERRAEERAAEEAEAAAEAAAAAAAAREAEEEARRQRERDELRGSGERPLDAARSAQARPARDSSLAAAPRQPARQQQQQHQQQQRHQQHAGSVAHVAFQRKPRALAAATVGARRPAAGAAAAGTGKRMPESRAGGVGPAASRDGRAQQLARAGARVERAGQGGAAAAKPRSSFGEAFGGYKLLAAAQPPADAPVAAASQPARPPGVNVGPYTGNVVRLDAGSQRVPASAPPLLRAAPEAALLPLSDDARYMDNGMDFDVVPPSFPAASAVRTSHARTQACALTPALVRVLRWRPHRRPPPYPLRPWWRVAAWWCC